MVKNREISQPTKKCFHVHFYLIASRQHYNTSPHATEVPWNKKTENFTFAYFLFTFPLRHGYLTIEEYLQGESKKYIQM